MKTILRAALLSLAFLLSPIAQAQSPLFADIKWGSTVEEVKRQLIGKGFKPTATDKDGDLKFEGKLLGETMAGWAMFSNKKLAKVFIVLATPDRRAIDKYNEVRKVLVEKYGDPSDTFKMFRRPYYEGDGYEEQAIRLGKARYSTFWGNGLYVAITDRLAVTITYESDEWGEEGDRRRAKSASAL